MVAQKKEKIKFHSNQKNYKFSVSYNSKLLRLVFQAFLQFSETESDICWL